VNFSVRRTDDEAMNDRYPQEIDKRWSIGKELQANYTYGVRKRPFNESK